MQSVRKPWWQQATALVTVSTGGVITGFNFVPGAAAAMTSPTSMPLHLMALEKAAQPADSGTSGDAALRSAIVNVANYYLRLAQSRTPAQMEALIWSRDSIDGADHGESCAAFASLTLELAAQAVGQQSWVTGGGSYPWPLHEWADVRVQTNPDSPGITSIVQDASAHSRWHPIGDGYQPQAGDWVLFDGHIEVVTGYAAGTLDTIGADSLPNLTVNAHTLPAPFADQGVVGFVDNGHLGGGTAAPAQPAQGTQGTQAPQGKRGAASGAPSGGGGAGQAGLAEIPGLAAPAAAGTGDVALGGAASGNGAAAAPAPTATATGGAAAGQRQNAKATAQIPGSAVAAGMPSGAAASPGEQSAAAPAPSYRKYTPQAQSPAPAPGTKAQQAFINLIAPGAMAAQQRYGVPASVTIAQAIEESAWGSSGLATQDYNLFGIKGSGPAGSVTLPTQEYEGGQWVTVNAAFRVYHNIAESISDHAELLANSGYYQRAMADRGVPDAFANDLTGVYATDPEYGSNLIALMRLYNLYRFDAPSAQQHDVPAVSPGQSATAAPSQAAAPG